MARDLPKAALPLLPVLLGILLMEALLPRQGEAAPGWESCRKTVCGPGKRQCIEAFRQRFEGEKAECMSAGSRYERRQCTKERRLVFKENVSDCKAACADCRECCRSGQQSQCKVAVCGDDRKVEGEECDGTDDEACPDRCLQDCTCAVCDCCQTMFDLMSFETVPGTGTAGWLRNFRCSNDDSACVKDSDCDFGTCYMTPPFCAGKLTVPCAEDTDCQGSCDEVYGSDLPFGLQAGHIYIGGGLFAAPISVPVPPEARSATRVIGCDMEAGALILGPSTPEDVGERHCTLGRSCSESRSKCAMDSDCSDPETCEDHCFLGPVMPIPYEDLPAESVCIFNVVGTDASGILGCRGDVELFTSVRSLVHLTGDLLKAKSPPDVPGIQPCPLCDTLCQGGSRDKFPCDDDSECPGGTCGTSTQCLGGPNDGDACTPEVPPEIEDFPLPIGTMVSHDCPPDAAQDITSNIGGVPVDLRFVSRPLVRNAVDRPGGRGVFSGFCRDVTGGGSLCFEGDPRPGCPLATPPAYGSAVPCKSDDECRNMCDSGGNEGKPCADDTDCPGGSCVADGDTYESCVQRNPGAFSFAEATQISVVGSAAGECVADGEPHATRLVTIFDIPPLFDPPYGFLDAAGDLPGPGAAILEGQIQLQNLP